MRYLAALPVCAVLAILATPAIAAGRCAATGASNRFLHVPNPGKPLLAAADLAGDYVHVLGTSRTRLPSIAVLRWSCSEQTTLPLPQTSQAVRRRT